MFRLQNAFVQALRSLRKSKSFSAAAVITLGLGVAAATSMFTLVNGVLLRPLPYPEADRLVTIERQTPQGPAGGLAIASMDDFAAGSLAADGFAAYRSLGFLEVGGLERPDAVGALEVTWNLLDVLGSRPALGSYFRPEHERGGNPVVVLTSLGVDAALRARSGCRRQSGPPERPRVRDHRRRAGGPGTPPKLPRGRVAAA